MNKYNSPNWVCPVCKGVVTLMEKDEAPDYCYKCPKCGEITGADEWKKRVIAEWIEHRNAYRLYYPCRPENTVAYVGDISEVDANNYDVLIAEVVFDRNGPSGNIYAILGMAQKVMKKQRRYTDFNTMRDRVFESKSYEDALAIIGEYVNLVDTTKNAAES